jgi:hypothetical protein
MNPLDLYSEGHLIVSAVRILTHQRKIAPSITSVCEILSVSSERGHQLFRKLEAKGIVSIVKSGYDVKVFIKNHLALEDLPKTSPASKLDEALQSFKIEKQNLSKNIEAIHSKQKQQKQKLYADLEKQLKAAKKKKT